MAAHHCHRRSVRRPRAPLLATAPPVARAPKPFANRERTSTLGRAMPYRAKFRCIAGCDVSFPLTQPIYRCPRCGGLLEVEHDIEALRDRSAAAWTRLFDERYKRTAWP